MKIANKFFSIVVLLTLTLTLTSCFKAKEKVFTKEGVSVTLDTTFGEISQENFQMVYVSSKYGFCGNGESKSYLPNIKTLKGYMQAVLSNEQKEMDILEYKEGDKVSFVYGYLEQNINGTDAVYMIFAKEGENKFYIFNIWCLKSKYNDKAKNKMMEIAKSVVVE